MTYLRFGECPPIFVVVASELGVQLLFAVRVDQLYVYMIEATFLCYDVGVGLLFGGFRCVAACQDQGCEDD